MGKAASIQFDSRKSYSAAQGNEPERRGWNEETYRLKNLDQNNRYDWSRHHLNFEVTKGGKVITLGSHETALSSRLYDRLHELGWKEYKQGADNAPNCIIDLVFSGDRDIMRKMAFGNQNICYDLSRKNIGIQRMPEIEKWAIDTYNWCCRKYGEENVIGFQVHLDETNPHAQVQVIPVAKKKQRGRLKFGEERMTKDTVSYYGLVGDTRKERNAYLENLHTEYHLQVGYKYGLERGKFYADLTEEEKKRRKKGHLSKEDLDRENKQQKLLKDQKLSIDENSKTLDELNMQIKRTETKIKSLSTMVHNLEQVQQQLEPMTQEHDELSAKLKQRMAQLESAKNNLADLEVEKDRLLNDIVGLQQEKDTTEEKLKTVENKIKERKQELERIEDKIEELLDQKAEVRHEYDDILRAINRERNKLDEMSVTRFVEEAQAQGWREFATEVQQRFGNIDDYRQSLSGEEKEWFENFYDSFLDGSVIEDAAQRGAEIIAVTAALYMGSVEQAINFAETRGGGGTSPDNNWGRRPDEDDDTFRGRCFLMARKMMRPPRRSQQQSRGPKR